MDYDLLKKRFEFMKNIDYVCNKYEYDDKLVFSIKNDRELLQDSIMLMIAEYYLYESCVDKKEQLNPHHIEMIEEYCEEKGKLCNYFRGSYTFADNVINNYLNMDEYIRRCSLILFPKNKKQIMETLEPTYQYSATTFLPTFIRMFAYNLYAKNNGANKDVDFHINMGMIKPLKISNKLLLSSIFADTYSYLRFEKQENKFTEMVDKLELSELMKEIIQNQKLFVDIMKCYFELYSEGYPDFNEMYLTNEHQDKDYKAKMLKLNSLYNVDKIAEFNKNNKI